MKNKVNRTQLLRDENIPEDSAVFLKTLSFGYSSKKLDVGPVDLDIKKGQSVAIIGHNGSGKSTLAKLIDGILVQNAGDIFIFGVRMTDDNALLLRKNMALVFQNPDSQFIGATVKDDIAFGLENECVSPKDMPSIIVDCAKKVGMEDCLESEPVNLSGGQKQRVAIAGALARNCPILILDEAGAMLDPKGKHEIKDIISEAKNRKPDMTIIKITHELEDAYDSDRVIVMNDGHIVMDGRPSDIFARDEELRSMRLDIPFSHKLSIALRNRGLNVPDADNEEEILDYLCR